MVTNVGKNELGKLLGDYARGLDFSAMRKKLGNRNSDDGAFSLDDFKLLPDTHCLLHAAGVDEIGNKPRRLEDYQSTDGPLGKAIKLLQIYQKALKQDWDIKEKRRKEVQMDRVQKAIRDRIIPELGSILRHQATEFMRNDTHSKDILIKTRQFFNKSDHAGIQALVRHELGDNGKPRFVEMLIEENGGEFRERFGENGIPGYCLKIDRADIENFYSATDASHILPILDNLEAWIPEQNKHIALNGGRQFLPMDYYYISRA